MGDVSGTEDGAAFHDNDGERDIRRGQQAQRPRRRQRLEDTLVEAAELNESQYVALEAFDVPLREWIQQDPTRREIKRRFRQFLRTFVVEGSGQCVYEQKIDRMAEENRQSLEVSYLHLSRAVPTLAMWVADAPHEILMHFNEVAKEVVYSKYPNYTSIAEDIFVRITDLPVSDSIRDIRQVHLGTLIKISGVVTRRTNVFPHLQTVYFDCSKCNFTMGPYGSAPSGLPSLSSCVNCGAKGPFPVNAGYTVYSNYQKIILQETPGTVPPGRLPRSKEVILQNDLIDCVRPGEEVEVTGIYANNFEWGLNLKNGFPVFSTKVEANYIGKREDLFSAYKLTEEDVMTIRKLGQDPRIQQRIFKSVAPSIYGHEHIKAAVSMALFGGQEKIVQGKSRIRGDINVLLLGDPGVAKSQFLKYAEKTAQRAVFTTGKGASAVGLTANVHKDPITREWTLEGGALVLGDRGVCLIDEFDKMNEQDRTSIHEAMEQQSISVSKAGIVTSLQARCSVIAAANPLGGRYDSSRTFIENVDLTEPILTRFDCLCVVKDTVDPVQDELLARFVVGSHVRNHPSNVEGVFDVSSPDNTSEPSADPDIIPQNVLRKYIAYAKAHVFPKLQDHDVEKISQLYARLRQGSMVGQGMPLAVRHIESIIRMSEASARMNLRQYVGNDDVDIAVQTFLTSFLSTQKHGVQHSLGKRFRRFMYHKKDYDELLLHLLKQQIADQVRYAQAMAMDVGDAMGNENSDSQARMSVDLSTLHAVAREYEVYDLSNFLESDALTRAGFFYDRSNEIIAKI